MMPSNAVPDPLQLKISSQRRLTDKGSNPLPIYCTIRHEIPQLEELEKQSLKSKDATSASERQKGADEKAKLLKKSRWMWFEITPCVFPGSKRWRTLICVD